MWELGSFCEIGVLRGWDWVRFAFLGHGMPQAYVDWVCFAKSGCCGAEIGFVLRFLGRGASPSERPGLNLWRHALRAFILFGMVCPPLSPPVFGVALPATT